VRTLPTALTAVAATLVGLAVKPRVHLREDHVLFAAPPDTVLAHFRARFADDPEVIAADADRLVRRFQGRAGPFPYRTVEIVGFESGAVTFEHLRGPFATGHERFDLTPSGAGTRLTHRGTFRLKGGLWTWPLAVGPVRRAFEAHVLAHLQTLQAEWAVPRAAAPTSSPPPTDQRSDNDSNVAT